jgi:methionine--tRNA ligase beta chain
VQVAKIVAVEAVEGSEKLWKCRVDCGDENTRQILAGLQQHVPLEAMLNRMVVVICNLKAAKLAGHLSEGMVLAASSPDKSVVVPLDPPEGSRAGDPVHSHHPYSLTLQSNPFQSLSTQT